MTEDMSWLYEEIPGVENGSSSETTPEDLNARLRRLFDGRIVRKDLTKKMKVGANVPTYVLEFLLGQYCSSDDPEIVARGLENVKSILEKNLVSPNETELILSMLREHGSGTIIDKVTVSLDTSTNRYNAKFANLDIGFAEIDDHYPVEYDRLLVGGIWCIVRLEYDFQEGMKKNQSPFNVIKLQPIQMPHFDMDELKAARREFTKDEWIKILLRSTGMEPERFTERERWLLLTRLLPLVESNLNLVEFGPRSTGKSHVYKEISPNSILVSGGQASVASLFLNMWTNKVGLVGLWDCVAFDEVGGMTLMSQDSIQIMKDYMASGSFTRGRAEVAASGSMVFNGNINQSVEELLRVSTLFDPFPMEMGTDTAFLDRLHGYVPGWEIPKLYPEHFTEGYGFITDYLAGFLHELRKEARGEEIDRYFRLGSDINQRDNIAIRKMVSGFLKLIYPDGVYSKDELEEILVLALELRRRVKEQMKKLSFIEFGRVDFSYIDLQTDHERFVNVPEQRSSTLIPEGRNNPGVVYTVSTNVFNTIGVYQLESRMIEGSGKFERTGLGSAKIFKEATATAFNYLKANAKNISSNISTESKNYIIDYDDLRNVGMTDKLALPTLVALCSIALARPTQESMVVLGDITIGGNLEKVENLADVLQVCLDSGAKRVLLPIASAADLASVPAELMGHFNVIFYNSPEEAVAKALGVE